ncbi:hypothetical protein [Ekhidna sp.]|uniref:hypothetical protein n=1 Tax=Ekhidna sp. TaxID=2608089 RepID=UPI003296D560
MKEARIIFILLVILIFHDGLWAQNGSPTRIDNEEPYYHQVTIMASSITIHGQTNVNRFKCGMHQPALNDSIVVKNIWSNFKLDFEGLQLVYKVQDFECGLKLMNTDFQELLKAEEEPYLLLELNSITLHPGNDAFEELDVDAEVGIFLAGVEKHIKVPCVKVYNHSSAHMTLQGKKDLQMTEFEIEPPSKFLGMVKVNDEIEIEFEISMKVSIL